MPFRDLPAKIDDLIVGRRMIQKGDPYVPHRLLGLAQRKQSREEFLLGARCISPWTAWLAAPRRSK